MRSLPSTWHKLWAKLGYSRKQRRQNARSLAVNRLLRMEQCEDRRMLAVFTVTETYDAVVTGPGDAPGTLRQAIYDANQDDTADTILFDLPAGESIITLGIDDSGMDVSPNPGELEITEAVTIDAEGQAVTIDASGNDNDVLVDDGGGSRIFNIDIHVGEANAVTVALVGLGLTGADSDDDGGAIYLDTSGSDYAPDYFYLSLEGVTVFDNHSQEHGGALGSPRYSYGHILISDGSSFLGNSAGYSGGALEISSALKSVNIQDSLFDSNIAGWDGGAIYAHQFGNDGLALSKINDQEITIERSEFTRNEALGDGTGLSRGDGGAIYADMEGDGRLLETLTLKIVDTTIDSNFAARNGGGLWVCTKHGLEFNMVNSTLSNNFAGSDPEYDDPIGNGGGLWMAFAEDEEGLPLDAVIEQITVSGNSALHQGGGIWVGSVGGAYINYSGGAVYSALNFSTITDNWSPDGGGIYSGFAPDPDDSSQRVFTTLNNSIVSANFTDDTKTTDDNVAGQIESPSDYNLFGTSTATLPTNSNILSEDDPELEALANNGGLTKTHLPLITSPAVDAGNPGVLYNASDFDQRGAPFARVVDESTVTNVGRGPVDIGAVELGEDVAGPRVTEVVISSSASGSDRSYYQLVNQLNDENGDQILALDFIEADTIEITFDDAMSIAGDELQLKSIRTGLEYPLSYVGSTNNTHQWELENGEVLDESDQVLLILPDSVRDTSGRALDGEWINPISLTTTDNASSISEFPSGDGTQGGDFRFVFTTAILGDYDGNNIVSGSDQSAVLLNWGALESTLGIGWAEGIDGNDIVSQNELDEVVLAWGDNFQELYFHGDFNNDGIVDLDDLDIILDNWAELESTVTEVSDEVFSDSDDFIGQWELNGVLLNWKDWFATNINENPLG